MDPVTIFLAKLAGPAILAMGLGIFFSRPYYVRVYRNLEQETLAVFMGGLTILTAGIAVVLTHNRWDSLLAGIISFIGWSSILKGLTLIVAPKMVDTFGNAIGNSKLFPIIATITTVVGAYVTYAAYMM